MKLVALISFFTLSIASAQDLTEFFHSVYDHVNEDWNRFELSAEIKSDHKSLLLEISETPGLEDLDFKTLLGKRDLEDFVLDIFKTPYKIPHFCYNFRGFVTEDLWSKSKSDLRANCMQRVRDMIKPLAEGDFVVRTFKLKGSTPRQDFYKAKIMAEDLAAQKSVIINFDVVLD